MKVVISTQKVEAAGLVSTIKNFLNKLSEGWMRMVDKLGLDKDDSVFQIKEVKPVDKSDDSKGMDIDFVLVDPQNESEGVKGKITTRPQSDGKVIVTVKTDNNMINFKETVNPGEEPDSAQKAVDKLINDWKDTIKDMHGEIKESVSLKFAVSRTPIKGSEEDSIDLVAINANYELGEALEHMEAVVGSQSFLDLLPADGQTYEVNVEPSMEDEELVLTAGPLTEFSRDDFGTYDLLVELLKELVIMQFNFKTLLWNMKGTESIPLLDAIQSCRWDIDNQIDFVGDLCHMLYGITPNPYGLADTSQIITPNPETKCISYVEAYGYVYNMLTDYKNLLENVYVNFTDDVKYRFADYLYSTKQSIHRLDRIADTGVCDDVVPLVIQPLESLEV